MTTRTSTPGITFAAGSKLVPYLKNWRTGNFTVRNPLLDDPTEQVSTNLLPSGVSQVPFRCRWQGQDEDAAMEFLGGFLGVTQDASTLALRPKLGWAVRQGSELDRLFVAARGGLLGGSGAAILVFRPVDDLRQ